MAPEPGGPVDARTIVRGAYAVASDAYRGDAFVLDATSGYAHWLRRLERRLAAGARVLDLGCGNGIPVARELRRCAARDRRRGHRTRERRARVRGADRPPRRWSARTMKFDYSKWRGPRPEDVAFIKQLMDIYRNLLLQTGGDADEALRWM